MIQEQNARLTAANEGTNSGKARRLVLQGQANQQAQASWPQAWYGILPQAAVCR